MLFCLVKCSQNSRVAVMDKNEAILLVSTVIRFVLVIIVYAFLS